MSADLIERLEAASEGSEELDFEIERALHGGAGFYDPVDRYTRSVDAALTLVPPEYDWIIAHTNGGMTVHAQVGPAIEVFAETPALAICIASLKARMAAKEGSDVG